jgi:major membrane immunogen (membrane-anchored lipoprotein)
MNSRFFAGCVVASSLLLAACGKEESIRASSYKQTCSKDDDCKTVLVGDPCKCACDTASISSSDMDEYTRDVTKIKGECVDELLTCTKCPELKGSVCTAGFCRVSDKLTK